VSKSGAFLPLAALSGADLSGADLEGANVTGTSLGVCRFLEGATMPDGSKQY
jgi:uncharacterized protein YjbI with pentapeptide repeats